jgi:hypothetical protein
MTDIGFAPKEVIAPQVCRLEVLDADKADTYGPQIAVKLKVIDGEHDGHTFTDYANRDEYTGRIKQGSKAWTIFEACLGRDFYKRSDVSLRDLVGKQFMAQVTQTRTSSRNKLEFGQRSISALSRATTGLATTRSTTFPGKGMDSGEGIRPPRPPRTYRYGST